MTRAMLEALEISFEWPRLLWLLVLVPVVAILYARHRARASARQGLPGSLARVTHRLRHLPPVVLMLGLTAILVSVARPQASLPMPSRVESVMLALDISGSMRADDVKPSRIAAAREAALSFVRAQPQHVRIGVVAVAGSAAIVQAPTTIREDIERAIGRLRPQAGTALGNGLILSLASLMPAAGIDVDAFVTGREGARFGHRQVGGFAERTNWRGRAARDCDGWHQSRRRRGLALRWPEQCRPGAPARGRGRGSAGRAGVFTVGIGTGDGARVSADGWSMRVRLDETELRQVASITRPSTSAPRMPPG
ncbi:MAG: VWA domain-containing protein [Burkholderiaceae bacterium]